MVGENEVVGRRIVMAKGALHVMAVGEDAVVLQVRTPHVTTAENPSAMACKLGVRLEIDELLELVSALADMMRRMPNE